MVIGSIIGAAGAVLGGVFTRGGLVSAGGSIDRAMAEASARLAKAALEAADIHSKQLAVALDRNVDKTLAQVNQLTEKLRSDARELASGIAFYWQWSIIVLASSVLLHPFILAELFGQTRAVSTMALIVRTYTPSWESEPQLCRSMLWSVGVGAAVWGILYCIADLRYNAHLHQMALDDLRLPKRYVLASGHGVNGGNRMAKSTANEWHPQHLHEIRHSTFGKGVVTTRDGGIVIDGLGGEKQFKLHASAPGCYCKNFTSRVRVLDGAGQERQTLLGTTEYEGQWHLPGDSHSSVRSFIAGLVNLSDGDRLLLDMKIQASSSNSLAGYTPPFNDAPSYLVTLELEEL
mmetsp:Transcript_31307/g.57363  ORF Transcript_31307/g.57363 Transcript_31307/m.57363 type:complete len:347 (+) Transcript_31307:97-1137(+)